MISYMSYLMRVVLPDRPGTLGAVATALGAAGIDIQSVTVVERSSEGAVDDLLFVLPPGGLADRALSAALSVPGVTVESLRPFLADGRAVAGDLDLADSLAEHPEQAPATLARLAPCVFNADWAVLLEHLDADDVRIRESSVGAPVLGGGDLGVPERVRLALPWLPLAQARAVRADEGGFPARWLAVDMALAAAPVGHPRLVILLGRPGGPAFRASEIARLAHLAGIAARLARRD
ncbi:ACT domain-containing protein [Candidatus Frankia nodulisporulans]|uniref:ACT domain-containing protein n=1 Tax=Candidatus Frankia nodulisporulans TaxID=2060052 RepID=UPI0013D2BC08|nr:ACT domain-containing protein [Candidatus Frankia nodulisporulans]